MGSVVRRALDALYLGAGVLAAAFLVAVFVLMIVMSAGRNFALNITDGTYFASWCMGAMSSLGLAHTFKKGEMIRVGLLLDKLSGRVKQVAEIIAMAVIFAFLCYLTVYAWDFVSFSRRMDDMSDGVLPIPLWIPQLSMLAGVVVLTIAVADELFRLLRGLPLSFERPPPQTPEEVVARAAEGGGV
jgi:TRAP-type C4-dicarboxylate transport system permease small subunit